jgi:hypothetical protein
MQTRLIQQPWIQQFFPLQLTDNSEVPSKGYYEMPEKTFSIILKEREMTAKSLSIIIIDYK